MSIDHGNEAILRTQCAQIAKDYGTEAALTMVIEMLESTKIISDKLMELMEKDEPKISEQMKLLCEYHRIIISTITSMRDKLQEQREEEEN